MSENSIEFNIFFKGKIFTKNKTKKRISITKKIVEIKMISKIFGLILANYASSRNFFFLIFNCKFLLKIKKWLLARKSNFKAFYRMILKSKYIQ